MKDQLSCIHEARCGVWWHELRSTSNESSAVIGRRAGWTGAYVRYVESGERTPPGTSEADRIVRAFHLPQSVIASLRAALSREELWWSWSEYARNLAAAVIDHAPVSPVAILSRNGESAAAYNLSNPAAWPRPAVVDLLCATIASLWLDEQGVEVRCIDGYSFRP